MYMRRAGAAGISGHLYESKLISLFYFRAYHDRTIEDFQIAANVDNIGRFDDICFKVKAKEFDKPVAVFIHAKHRVKTKITFGKNDLAEFFYSYCKIRGQFDASNKDSFFNGTFDDTECIFVIYTNTTIDPVMNIKQSVGSGFTTKLFNLIGTGGTVKQLCNNAESIEYLCKVIMKEQMFTLAYRIAKFIMIDNGNGQMLLTDELVQRYHVILGQQVFDVSEIQPEGYRFASFRYDFFDTHDEYLTIFKHALFKAIIKIQHLEQGYVSQLTMYEAKELAAKQILLSPMLKLRVPSAFGNKDIPTKNGHQKRAERRIIHIASKIINLIDKCKSNKIVTIDESLPDGFLRLNGGIAGAIGNIFVLDDNTKLMKITDNSEQLGPLANMLYTELNSEIHNLHEYKFYFIGNKFPQISFDCYNYEENLVRDFLNRLMFYTHQADEDHVEKILKNEIEYYQSNQPNYFQAKTDAIFSNFHDKIQKWWMQPEDASYLTRESNLFQASINNIIKDPLMSSINLTCKSKINQYNYTFTEDAVSSLSLPYHSSIIITENRVLTVVKVLQYLENRDHVVLDFKYIARLPTNNRDGLFLELSYTDEKKVLILVYDKTNSSHDMKHLEKIAQAVQQKQTIVVTNQTSFEMIHKYFLDYKVIQDKKLSLIDLSVESQKSITENASAMFPDVETKLDLLLIQKWWMQTRGAHLTQNFKSFQASIKNIIKDPLMSSINLTYMSKINLFNYTFTEDAVSSLNLPYQSSIIITENSALTVVKMLQYLENKDHVVLDFEYIAHLPTNDRNGLFSELSYTDEKKVLILVYDKTNSSHDMKHLAKIAQAVQQKQTIVVTNQTSFEIIRKYFPYYKVQDKKLSLIDLSVESQKSITENALAMFPGVELKLDLLLRGWPKTGSRLSCVTAPRARQQSDVDGASTSQERSAAAAADSETGKPFLSRSVEPKGPLSRQTEEEEKNVPGMSCDPLSAP